MVLSCGVGTLAGAIIYGASQGIVICATVGVIGGGGAGASSFMTNSAYISQYGGNVKEVLSAYKENPKLKVLNNNTMVYRTWGGASGQYGHWISYGVGNVGSHPVTWKLVLDIGKHIILHAGF